MALIIFESTSTAFAREIENSVNRVILRPTEFPYTERCISVWNQNWIDPSYNSTLTLLNFITHYLYYYFKKVFNNCFSTSKIEKNSRRQFVYIVL